MNKHYRTLGNLNPGLILLISCAVLLASAPLSAQTFTSLGSFAPNQGADFNTPLVQGLDGNFYGAVSQGGTSKACGGGGCGTLFRITPEGVISVVYTSIRGSEEPGETLQLASDGSFFTTTMDGGPYYDGSVVRITPQGSIRTLHAFSGPEGANPTEGVIQGFDGNFYGWTVSGGSTQSGTFFKINTSGQLTSYNLASVAQGFWPMPMVQCGDGNFYTTFLYGGLNDHGAVIKVTPKGVVTVLHSFTDNDGQGSFGGVIEGPDGSLYGTTQVGGTATLGTVYRITPAGAYTVLHSFTGPDGEYPEGITLGTDGNFYGVTLVGGANNYGTIFQITPHGSLKTLYHLCSQANCADGRNSGKIMQGTDGNFYGTTALGGAPYDNGTFFKLSMGLAPFVKTAPAGGAVGRQVKILGNDLTGTTSVTFNGTPAAFTVISPTAIATTVPAGATTGTVVVTTPSAKLKSNVAFRIP
ncbi:MAG TPA: choice-of-anchor tandem repeat GloVer-containing protein [Candidatus Sulfotelmatobacter sp.]|nr:choice-of-anchor tandem repeat GloVer-containing protein [Candidatus Sulfotelmatobacter sp.]